MPRIRKVLSRDYVGLIKESEGKIIKLMTELKAERANLKKLKKDKERYETQKEEEEKMIRTNKVADMIASSGKSLEEIEKFLSGK